MSNGYDRQRHVPGRGPAGPRGRSGSRPRFEDEPDEEVYEDDETPDEDRSGYGRPRQGARPRGRPGGGRVPPPRRSGGSWSLFGSKRPAARPRRRDEGLDWDAAEDGGYGEAEYESERDYGREADDDEPAPRRHAPSRKSPRRGRVTLTDLCTPIFAYAAMLPRDAGGIHPAYQQFRQEVLGALQKIESEAPEHGIDKDDAREARYALALFMDEQVADSEWSGKAQWSGEPLNVVLLNDPEGGVNFFNHLEALGDRQRAVKKVYLAALAMGFRGKFADLDPTQQAARIGEIRQRLLRSIQDPIEKQDVLFPESYEPAAPLEGQAPPPPKGWMAASLGIILVVLVLWFVLFYLSGVRPKPVDGEVRKLLNRSAEQASEPSAGRIEAPEGGGNGS